MTGRINHSQVQNSPKTLTTQKKQDKELNELRELNAQQAKEITAKNREIEQLKSKTGQLQRELDALRKQPKTTRGSGSGPADEDRDNPFWLPFIKKF